MPYSFLVVDDDPDGLFFTERILKRFFPSCQVVPCSSATAAVAELEQGARVDAIVTDHQLGKQSGCEFIAHVRQSGLTCPVVMVTCSGDPEIFARAYGAGASKVFMADGEEFAEFLKQALRAAGETG